MKVLPIPYLGLVIGVQVAALGYPRNRIEITFPLGTRMARNATAQSSESVIAIFPRRWRKQALRSLNSGRNYRVGEAVFNSQEGRHEQEKDGTRNDPSPHD
jgi:CTP synthase (UTP-ammonia lyase)